MSNKKLPSPKKKVSSPKTNNKPAESSAPVCSKSSKGCNLVSRSKFDKVVGFVSSPLSIPLWILVVAILLKLTK